MRGQRQRGISLISLMVGLLVSLLAVMGMMALYRTVMHTTAESGAYARLSSERSAALLGAHAYLQEAGFGMEGAAPGADLIVCTSNTSQGQLRGSDCAPSGRGNLLLWRLLGVDENAGVQCAGLLITAAGALEHLQPQSCAGGLPSGAWSVTQRQALFTPEPTTAGFVALELVEESCQTFGVDLGVPGAALVRLQAQHPVAADPDTGTESVPVYSSTCLVNFKGGEA
ncbi:hypothetical protein SAMN05216198_2434 [Halopseudomonas litoralis]|uniref:Uncharacterized protein n=1 Tax=Halopseudomonas litoralis TaxID=797277 RepID=A0A1H1TXT2_9GAMM|nr:hypothetical protein SAMN05216198_2434 [Halopseudomonas litoralis]